MIKYLEWNQKLLDAYETEIFELTGCLSTCDKNEYSSQPMIETATVPSDNLTNIIRLGFVFQSGRHELKEQA